MIKLLALCTLLAALSFTTVNAQGTTTVTQDNINEVLKAQLEELDQPEKTRKGLILAFMTRDANALEMQRVLNELQPIVSRQYTIGVVDCQYERQVCLQFKPKPQSVILFKPDSIYEHIPMASQLTKKHFLEFLSGDEHKTMSTVWADDTKQFLLETTGQLSGSGLTNMIAKMEEKMTVQAKSIFKKAGLGHWSDESKTSLYIMAVCVPVCILIILAILFVIFGATNWYLRRAHNADIKELREHEAELIAQITKLMKSQ